VSDSSELCMANLNINGSNTLAIGLVKSMYSGWGTIVLANMTTLYVLHYSGDVRDDCRTHPSFA
jgi:subtilase family serine protease